MCLEAQGRNVCKYCGSIIPRKSGRRVPIAVKDIEAGQYNEEYQAFLAAVEEYKRCSHKRFLRHTEYLYIVKEMGYERKRISESSDSRINPDGLLHS